MTIRFEETIAIGSEIIKGENHLFLNRRLPLKFFNVEEKLGSDVKGVIISL